MEVLNVFMGPTFPYTPQKMARDYKETILFGIGKVKVELID